MLKTNAMFLSAFSALLFVLSSLPQQKPAAAGSIAPPQNFQIAGVVVDALSAQPLSHTQVFIQGQSIANSGQATTTGDDGRFVFDNVAPSSRTNSTSSFPPRSLSGPTWTPPICGSHCPPTPPFPDKSWMK